MGSFDWGGADSDTIVNQLQTIIDTLSPHDINLTKKEHEALTLVRVCGSRPFHGR